MKKIITLILSTIIILSLTSCRELPEERSSIVTSEIVVIESKNSDPSSSDVVNTSSESAPSKPEPTPTVNAATSSEETVDSTPSSTPTSNNTTSSSGTAKVVQLANTETGISWDGVSPIIYTYPDGTTGTEKREGATYEQIPGMIDTVVDFGGGSDYDGTCWECGKEEGTGTNGTCIRPFDDMICTGCGEHLSKNVCHTCDE